MEYFIIDRPLEIHLPESASDPIITDILGNYTYGLKHKPVYDSENFEITLGEPEKAALTGEFVLNITERGVYIAGRNYSAMMRGFVTFFEKIFCYDKLLYKAACGLTNGEPAIGFRAVHICVFPETTFEFLEKIVYLAAISRYTHIVIEFWGMIALESFPEMAWPQAYTKEQIRALCRRANSLGLEVIPMLQHLGHAAMARQGASGKHVVLDKAPWLEYLYKPGFYGWVWDYEKPCVRELLKNIRDELIEISGKGEYFLLGCDEADDLGQGEDSAKVAHDLCEYLNEVSDDLKSKGRRAVIWADMLLCREDVKSENLKPGERYESNSSKEFAGIMIENLSRDIIIADWQYLVRSENWKSSEKFARNGFDVICCPFSDRANIAAAINTVKAGSLYGFMKTTWHTLNRETPILALAGDQAYSGNPTLDYAVYSKTVSRVCATLRHVTFTRDYRNAGWSDRQIGPGL